MKQINKEIEIGGRALTISTGKLAGQATSAVLAQYGDTVVLATVVAAPMKMDPGYFPLSVEYQERLYAGGIIKGSRWVKREGRPTDEEILTGRLIDRSIRPLFPKNYKKEVQVIITVLSVDHQNSPDMPAAVAVSAALTASSIPWKGPIGTVKVGYKDGTYFTNPTEKDLDLSDMELVVSGTQNAIVMIEDGSKEVEESIMMGGIAYAFEETKKIISLISDFAKEVGAKKEELPAEEKNSALLTKVQKLATPHIEKKIADLAKGEGSSALNEVKSAVISELSEEDPIKVGEAFDKVFTGYIRKIILSGKRPDGRKHTEIRALSAEVGVLPRTHGSGLFQRGQTQVLTVATLGGPSLGQLIESVSGEEEKRYMHHYSFPPFSVGETGRIGSPNRREIGHGALAERALMPVLPPEDKFPYAIRLVSEVLSSNGSTSMGSTCGSTLALMDAGVPITAPVSGIAMGLVIEDEKNFAVLTDIMGLEDFNGDMDFKVAGTAKGITALQLDVKTLNLTLPILQKAIDQAKVARLEILDVMVKAISEPRATVSSYAPKVKSIKIPTDKIGELIGPGGKNIKRLMADTQTQVDVEDDGTVSITAISEEGVAAAYAYVEALTKEVVPGEIYEGTVKRIQPFGAFVEILPGKEGLVHVSDMSEDYVSDPNEKVQLGDKVQVRVKEIDELRRINLSMLLDPSKDKERADRGPRGGGSGSRGGFGRDRGPRRDMGDRRFSDRGRGPRRDGGRSDRGASGGPHFPTSRYLDQGPKKFSR